MRASVIGIGPGDPDLMHMRARALIELADVVAGFTLHTRAPADEAVLEGATMLRSGNRRVLSLIRPYEIMPNRIAALWLEAGVAPQPPVAVLERLSLPDERISFFTLGDLAVSEREFSDLSIVVAGSGVC